MENISDWFVEMTSSKDGCIFSFNAGCIKSITNASIKPTRVIFVAVCEENINHEPLFCVHDDFVQDFIQKTFQTNHFVELKLTQESEFQKSIQCDEGTSMENWGREDDEIEKSALISMWKRIYTTRNETIAIVTLRTSIGNEKTDIHLQSILLAACSVVLTISPDGSEVRNILYIVICHYI